MTAPDLQEYVRMLERGQVAAVRAELEQAVNEEPAHAAVHLVLARAYELEGRDEDAIDSWRTVYALVPESPAAGRGLRRALRRRLIRRRHTEFRTLADTLELGVAGPFSPPAHPPADPAPEHVDSGPVVEPPSPSNDVGTEESTGEAPAGIGVEPASAAEESSPDVGSPAGALDETQEPGTMDEPTASPGLPPWEPAANLAVGDGPTLTESGAAPPAEAEFAPPEEADVSPPADAEFAPPLEADAAPPEEADVSPPAEAEFVPPEEADVLPPADAEFSPPAEAVAPPEADSPPAPEPFDRKSADPEYLDELIRELETARIVPDPTVRPAEAEEIESDVEDVVSETLARIYANQRFYEEAARVYDKLASQQPKKAVEFRTKAAEIRGRITS